MNAPKRFLVMTAVAVAVMLASSCVCVVDPSANRRGNVTFLWTFGGQPCAIVPSVTSVSIQIPGHTLDNNGVYGCLNGSPSTAGITLLNFGPGTYQFTIQGNDAGGNALYTGAGTFVVSGDVTVNVDLKANANAPGNALVTWAFPQNATCANAVASEAIETVDIIVDSSTPSRQACNAGIRGSQGLQISALAAGTHTIELRAYGHSGYQYFGVRNSIVINAGGTVAGEFQLQYVVGSLPVKWQFVGNNAALTCDQLSNPMVYVNLRDSAGNLLYTDNNGAGTAVPCKNAAGLQGTLFGYLIADTYQIIIQAYGPGQTLYHSNQTSPPSAVVTAGSFPVLDANTFAINVTYP